MTIAFTRDRKAIALHDDHTWTVLGTDRPVIDLWRSAPQPPSLVRMLDGLFRRLGVHIEDTGEELTCLHRGARIEFEPGVDHAGIDYLVRIYAFQAEQLAEEARRDDIDPLDQFRIARELLQGIAEGVGRRNVLANPLMSNPILRAVIRGKNLAHLTLLSPDPSQEPDANFSLLFVHPAWILVPGRVGMPKRLLRVSVDNGLDLQRHLFAASSSGGLLNWWRTALWYVEWRKRVEAPIA